LFAMLPWISIPLRLVQSRPTCTYVATRDRSGL
jgi:hypothetical protein